ncbi:MAG: AAA family ATPase [Candidatus Thorarchaeota archaeon]
MRLIRLELQNFKPFRKLTLPAEDEELPKGLIIVRGPNSTGKSSIFEAILWALWGSGAVEPANDELINFASSFCDVRLEFDIAGTKYEINRSYDPAKGMSVVLSEKKNGNWKRIADKNQTVSRSMEDILNLEHQQALQTLLVRQGEVALIANATPTVLRELLEKVYNIELLGEMKKQLANLEANLKTNIDVLEKEYRPPEHIREQIANVKKRIVHDERELKKITKESRKAEELLKTLPDPKDLKRAAELLEDIRIKEGEHKRVLKLRERELQMAGIADSNPEIIRARLEFLKKESAKLDLDRDTIMEKSHRIEREIGEHKALLGDVEEKITGLTKVDEGGLCPICQKPLSAHECNRIVSEYKSTAESHKMRIDALSQERDAIPDELKEIDDRLRTIPRAIDAASRLADQQREADAIASEAGALANTLGSVLRKMNVESVKMLLKKHKVNDILHLQSNIIRLKETLIANKTSIESASKRIERGKEEVKELEEKQVKMKELGAQIQSIEELKEHTTYVRRKLVSGFIADYIFQKRLIGIIRKATNVYVDAFTNGQYTSIDLEPTPAKGRAGPGLLLRIWDERDKAKKRSSQLSFGDRTAISLGLRLGISRTMSSIRPLKESPAVAPRVRSVLLDEPLGGLDRGRRISVVKNLVNDQSFEQIFLITHTDVGGWEGVPVIEVSKSGSGSDALLVLSPDV